jgi:hypothetical protein
MKRLIVISMALALSTNALSTAYANEQVDRIADLEARVAQLEARLAQALGALEQASSSQPQSTAAAEAPAAVNNETEPSWQIGGYIKTDVIASRYSGGELAAGSIGRDFFIPGTIPVGGEGSDTQLDAHARQTRLFARGALPLGDGQKATLYLETDFLVTPGGDERVSNSYTPRVRHAFINYGKWLVGQTWSNFQNVAALPDVVDFIGPSGATVFMRQPQVRYTAGKFSFSLENPETTITPFGGGARVVTDDNSLPDITARYAWSGDGHSVQLAGIVRELQWRNVGLADDSTRGWGVSLSGKTMLGENDIRWMISHGDGLGRYLGLNLANAAVIDANGKLEAIGSTAGFAAYRHHWSPGWRSSLVLGYTDIDNPLATGNSATDSVWSAQMNLLYSPLEALTIGLEYTRAERELVNGLDDRLDRLQFAVKYGF